MYIP
jgi:hypothetical protein